MIEGKENGADRIAGQIKREGRSKTEIFRATSKAWPVQGGLSREGSDLPNKWRRLSTRKAPAKKNCLAILVVGLAGFEMKFTAQPRQARPKAGTG